MVGVRDFRTSDYPAVRAIDAAEQRAYRGVRWDAASEGARGGWLMTSERYIEDYVASGTCLVAEQDESLVGFLFALPLLPDVLYVDALAVLPEMRRKGVASSLYRALFDRARGRGIKHVRASITPDNDASIGLHAAAGFSLRRRKEAVLQI